MSQLFVNPFTRATLSTNVVAAGAQLTFYLSGTTTKAKILTLYGAIDVSDQGAFEAMARLGLQMVRVPLP